MNVLFFLCLTWGGMVWAFWFGRQYERDQAEEREFWKKHGGDVHREERT